MGTLWKLQWHFSSKQPSRYNFWYYCPKICFLCPFNIFNVKKLVAIYALFLGVNVVGQKLSVLQKKWHFAALAEGDIYEGNKCCGWLTPYENIQAVHHKNININNAWFGGNTDWYSEHDIERLAYILLRCRIGVEWLYQAQKVSIGSQNVTINGREEAFSGGSGQHRNK